LLLMAAIKVGPPFSPLFFEIVDVGWRIGSSESTGHAMKERGPLVNHLGAKQILSRPLVAH
jgi:hypothetical protein